MLKFILLLAISVHLNAIDLKHKYSVGVTFLGTIANAVVYLDKNETTYSIKVEVKSSGFTSFLTKNRVEIYKSNGIVRDNILIPLVYTKLKTTNKYSRLKKYTFDHKNNQVIFEKRETKSGSNEVQTSKSKYDFYAKNDILSLYFNLLNIVKEDKRDHFVFHAIGANSQNGKLDVYKLKDKALKNAKWTLGINSGYFLKLKINSKKTPEKDIDIFVNYDQDGICNKFIIDSMSIEKKN